MATQRVSDDVLDLVEKYRSMEIKIQKRIVLVNDPADAGTKEMLVKAWEGMSFNGVVRSALECALRSQLRSLEAINTK